MKLSVITPKDKGVLKNHIDLSISIVHHKNKEFLEKCLDSIFKETKNVTLEIFVIDNCSNDKIPELIKKKYPGITLIRNNKTEGFASNHNKALKLANGRYLLILNNDTIILDSAFDKMVQFMDTNLTIGALGCKMYLTEKMDSASPPSSKYSFTPLREFWDSLVGHSGIQKIFHNSPLIYKPGCSTAGPKAVDTENEVAHISGACMMVRKEVATQVGLMDENYMMFLEETDWCYRIKKQGWKMYYYPKAYIIHYGSKSLGYFENTRKKLHEESLAYFFKKHYGIGGFLLFKMLRIVLFPLMSIHKLYLKITYPQK
ncbi:MAG: glycosyltransferase family 2 protein [bacterium]